MNDRFHADEETFNFTATSFEMKVFCSEQRENFCQMGFPVRLFTKVIMARAPLYYLYFAIVQTAGYISLSLFLFNSLCLCSLCLIVFYFGLAVAVAVVVWWCNAFCYLHTFHYVWCVVHIFWLFGFASFG